MLVDITSFSETGLSPKLEQRAQTVVFPPLDSQEPGQTLKMARSHMVGLDRHHGPLSTISHLPSAMFPGMRRAWHSCP